MTVMLTLAGLTPMEPCGLLRIGLEDLPGLGIISMDDLNIMARKGIDPLCHK